MIILIYDLTINKHALYNEVRVQNQLTTLFMNCTHIRTMIGFASGSSKQMTIDPV